MVALLGIKQPQLASLHIFRLSHISEEGTVGWGGTRSENIQLSSQQESPSLCNLQLIASFVFSQRTVCDVFAQMHEHSKAELAHSLMLEEILCPFSLSFWHNHQPQPQRSLQVLRGFILGGGRKTFLILFFNNSFLISNIQRKWSLSLLRQNVSSAIKVKISKLPKQMNTRYSTWTIKPKLYEFYISMDNTNIVPASLLPFSLRAIYIFTNCI